MMEAKHAQKNIPQNMIFPMKQDLSLEKASELLPVVDSKGGRGDSDDPDEGQGERVGGAVLKYYHLLG